MITLWLTWAAAGELVRVGRPPVGEDALVAFVVAPVALPLLRPGAAGRPPPPPLPPLDPVATALQAHFLERMVSAGRPLTVRPGPVDDGAMVGAASGMPRPEVDVGRIAEAWRVADDGGAWVVVLSVGWCPEADGWSLCLRGADTTLGEGAPGLTILRYGGARSTRRGLAVRRVDGVVRPWRWTDTSDGYEVDLGVPLGDDPVAALSAVLDAAVHRLERRR